MPARWGPLALFLAASVVLGACGGDDDSGGGGNPLAAGSGTNADGARPASNTTSNTTAPPAAGGAGSGALPDPCSLLTADEIGQVAPGATPAPPENESTSGVQTATCYWDNPDDKVTLTLLSGIPSDQIQPSLEAEANDYGGKPVDLGGDHDGVVFSSTPIGADTKVVTGGVLVTVELIGTGASGKQDALVGLTRTAVGRLG
jgi:hypothetical protein